MERRQKKDVSLKAYRDYHLAIEGIIRESFKEKNSYIRALEDEVLALRSVTAILPLDSKFWIGFPIGCTGDPRERETECGR